LPILSLAHFLVALLPFLYWPARSSSAPLKGDDELSKYPPLADVDHLLRGWFLKDWEEQQAAYTQLLKRKVDGLLRAKQVGEAINRDRLQGYRQLLEEANRRVRLRVAMQHARDESLPEKERRRWLGVFRDQFPKEYPAWGKVTTDAIPVVPPELREEWDIAYLDICPPLPDAEKFPSREALAERLKMEESYVRTMQDKIDQLEAADAAGKRISLDIFNHYADLRNKAYDLAHITRIMQQARNPEATESSRRHDLRRLRVRYPDAYASRRWPDHISPVPPELREAFRAVLSGYPESTTRPPRFR
jgi:hypothetical protein